MDKFVIRRPRDRQTAEIIDLYHDLEDSPTTQRSPALPVSSDIQSIVNASVDDSNISRSTVSHVVMLSEHSADSADFDQRIEMSIPKRPRISSEREPIASSEQSDIPESLSDNELRAQIQQQRHRDVELFTGNSVSIFDSEIVDPIQQVPSEVYSKYVPPPSCRSSFFASPAFFHQTYRTKCSEYAADSVISSQSSARQKFNHQSVETQWDKRQYSKYYKNEDLHMNQVPACRVVNRQNTLRWIHQLRQLPWQFGIGSDSWMAAPSSLNPCVSSLEFDHSGALLCVGTSGLYSNHAHEAGLSGQITLFDFDVCRARWASLRGKNQDRHQQLQADESEFDELMHQQNLESRNFVRRAHVNRKIPDFDQHDDGTRLNASQSIALSEPVLIYRTAGRVQQALFSPHDTDRLVACFSNLNEVHIYDLNRDSHLPVSTLVTPSSQRSHGVGSVHMHPEKQNMVFVGTKKSEVWCWDARSSCAALSFRSTLVRTALSVTDTGFGMGMMGGSTIKSNISTGSTAPVKSIQVTNDGNKLFVAREDGVVDIVDIRLTARALQSLNLSKNQFSNQTAPVPTNQIPAVVAASPFAPASSFRNPRKTVPPELRPLTNQSLPASLGGAASVFTSASTFVDSTERSTPQFSSLTSAVLDPWSERYIHFTSGNLLGSFDLSNQNWTATVTSPSPFHLGSDDQPPTKPVGHKAPLRALSSPFWSSRQKLLVHAADFHSALCFAEVSPPFCGYRQHYRCSCQTLTLHPDGGTCTSSQACCSQNCCTLSRENDQRDSVLKPVAHFKYARPAPHTQITALGVHPSAPFLVTGSEFGAMHVFGAD